MSSSEDILKYITTKEDLYEFIDLLDTLVENAFKKGSSFSKTLDKASGQKFSAAIKRIGNGKSPEQIQDILNKLKQEAEKVNFLSLTIAIEPSEELLTSLSKWAEKNFDNKVIFDITVNPDIVGGAIVTYKGNYRDESLKKTLEESFGKKEFIKNLSSHEYF